MKATADNTSASETKVKNEQHETQTEEKDTNDFHEYDALKKVVDLNEFTIEEVEDNQNKHVIILKDDQDSILHVAGGAVGFTMKATADNTSASETKVKNEQHETQTEEKDTNDFHEYDALKKVVDLNEFTIEEVEDNQNKHVIILKDDQD